MRSVEELAEVRALAHRRLDHRAEVARARDLITPGTLKISVWCSQQHGRGRSKKLAEAAFLDPEFLFVSRIDWLPSDQLNLRPWEREALLGSGWNHQLDEDDALLSQWLDHLDEWGAGLPARGARWLQKAPPRGIEVVLVPGVEPAYSPWVRCPDHPHEETTLLTVADLMAAARVS